MGAVALVGEGAVAPIISAIQAAGTDMIGNAGLVVAAAVAVGIAFWAPKALWRFFKGLAK